MAEGGDFPRILGGFEHILQSNNGGFICGSTVSIADCALLPVLRLFKSGRHDGIPASILDKYPSLAAYYDRMMQVPAVKAHYSCTDPGSRLGAEIAADYYYNIILKGRA
jgi:glutathione S-transferase